MPTHTRKRTSAAKAVTRPAIVTRQDSRRDGLASSDADALLLQRQAGNQAVGRILQGSEQADENENQTVSDEQVAAMGLWAKMWLAFKHSIPHWPGGLGEAARDFFTDPLTLGVLVATIAVFAALAFVPDPTLITKIAVALLVITLIATFGYETIKAIFATISNFYSRCRQARTVRDLEEAGRRLAMEGGEPLFNILLLIVTWRGGRAVRTRIERVRARQAAGAGEPAPSGEAGRATPQESAGRFDVRELIRQGSVNETVLKQMVIDSWRQGGGNRPVKVVSVQRGASTTVRGYITLEKFIRGRTPAEMERILGLPEGELTTRGQGAIIEVLEQVPTEAQFELRGYTQLPEGRTFEPGGKYPPGLGAPQWQLIQDIPAREIARVRPGEVFQPEVQR